MRDGPPHTFVFARRRRWDVPNDWAPPRDATGWIEWEFERATTDRFDDDDVFTTARSWFKLCAERHDKCPSARAKPNQLPTRVIDVGKLDGSDGRPKLITAQPGQTAAYAVLSHCWGGEIPCKLLDSNITEYYDSGLPIERLPQNFTDAIRLTRLLGLQYIWIDALCIIQNSKADWAAEAGRMTSVYSDATIAFTGLHAANSTVGLLGERAVPSAIIGRDFAVRKPLPKLGEVLEQCELDSRGWCMQERLLSPRLLHIGRDQMFWECGEGTCAEVGGPSSFTTDIGRSNQTNNTGPDEFAKMRLRAFGPYRSEMSMNDWYYAVEEYTTRRLTVSTDKLPAIAGVAKRFQSAGVFKEYMAGLWRDDLEYGLFWGAKTYRPVISKASGFQKAGFLTWPPGDERRAPSWSWASVDGPVEFGFVRDRYSEDRGAGRCDGIEIIHVNMETSDDDSPLIARWTKGSIRLRAPMVRMRYRTSYPTEDDEKSTRDVEYGYLQFLDPVLAKSRWWPVAVLDAPGYDRTVCQNCWVLLSSTTHSPYILLLAEVPGLAGTFCRIGFANSAEAPEGVDLEVQEIVLI